MNRSSSARILVALACLALATACTTTLRKAPNYEQRMKSVHKVGLMPPGASATLIVFQGDNREIPEVVTRVRDELVDSATSEIRQYDYLVDRIVIEEPESADEPRMADLKSLAVEMGAAPEVTPEKAVAPEADVVPAVSTAPPEVAPPLVASLETPLAEPGTPETETEVAADDELRFAASQAQKVAEQALDEMFATAQMNKKDALNYQRSLGPEINEFADMVDAEALLFVRYRYFSKSGGEIAKDVAFSVLLLVATMGNATVIQPVTVAQIEVCLVDGATGDVLYANVASAQEMVGDPSTHGLMKAAFAGFNPRGR